MLKLLLIIPILQIVYISAQEAAQNATQTESPWMVYFEVKGRRCGGAMIDDYHILTAAHCFDRIKYSEFLNQKKLREALKIRIGEWKTETDPDCGEDVSDEVCDTTADILPKEVFIHEKYNKRDQDKRYQYDIAIIKLGWPPRRSEVINVLRLTEPERCHEATSGEFWKTTGFGGESKVKKRMEMVLLSHEECVKSIDQSHLGKLNEQVHVCGRGLNGEKTCKGDAGSPVTNLVESIPYLQGIVTFTDEDECIETETNTASVFLRVPCFFDWINEKVPNISHAFIEKPKPEPTSGENKDTGDIEVVSAGESTTSAPRGTTLKNGRPPAVITTSKPTTRPTPITTRRVSPSRPAPTQAPVPVTETTTVGYNDYSGERGPEPELETTKSTAKPITKPTPAWRTTLKPKTTTVKPAETTTEDETLHFSDEPNEAGYNVRMGGDEEDQKEEEVSITTAKASRFSRPGKVTRPTAKAVIDDDY